MAIKVDDYVIYTSVENVITVLKNELLLDYGVLRFEKGKMTNNNYMTNCPFHAEGREKKPSFGISADGQCHCFACGYSATNFKKFINNLFEHDDNDDFATIWVARHLDVIETGTRNIQLNLNRKHSVSKIQLPEVPESILASYRYTHPYMYQRGLTDEIIELFDVGYDLKNHCLTFPVKDLEGRVIAVLTRSVIYKYFYIPEDLDKPVYAGDLMVSGKYKEVYVCESILNALTCWVLGKPAVALIGTGTQHQIDILKRLPVRHYILALDPDDAGNRGTERLHRGLKGYKLLSKIIYNKGDKRDINDLRDEFLSLKTQVI